jgi:hypothetical protein
VFSTFWIFRSRGVRQGGGFYLSVQDAIDMVCLCQERGIPVLGLSGFWLSETTTQPSLAHEVEFSDAASSWEQSRDYLEGQLGSGMFFEIDTDEYTVRVPRPEELSDLERELKDQGIWAGRSLKLKAADAIEMVSRYQEADQSILGVECFEHAGLVMVAQLEKGLDLSSSVDDCWGDARCFLKQYLGSDLYFDIVTP